MDADEAEEELERLKRQGAIIELLDPQAREFNNIPQSSKQAKRVDCSANDGSHKAHYLTT